MGNWGSLTEPGNCPFIPNRLFVNMLRVAEDEQSKAKHGSILITKRIQTERK